MAVDLCHIDLHPRVSSGAKVSNGSAAERLLAEQMCLLLGHSVNVGLLSYLKFDDESGLAATSLHRTFHQFSELPLLAENGHIPGQAVRRSTCCAVKTAPVKKANSEIKISAPKMLLPEKANFAKDAIKLARQSKPADLGHINTGH